MAKIETILDNNSSDDVYNTSITEVNNETAENGDEETTDDVNEETTEEIVRNKGYELLRDEYEYCLFSADQWISDGRLVCPFDVDDDVDLNFYEKMARYYVPEDALDQANTQDILDFVMQWPYISLHVYEFPSYQLEHMSDYLNAFDYLLSREDVADVLIDNYIEEKYYSENLIKDNNITSKEARKHAEKIGLMELILSMNEICSKMTLDEQEKCIEHAYDIWYNLEYDEEYVDAEYSYFFFHIKEEIMLRNSEWKELNLPKKTNRLLASALADIPNGRFL